MTTTVSSTPCLKSARTERRWPVLLPVLFWGWAMCMAWLPAPAAAQARTGASITQMRLEQADDGIYFSAAVQFELPSLVEEVLDKGIAIYFVAEAELYQERWYWTDRKVAQVTRHMRLAYQPLTRRWRLNVSAAPMTGAAGLGISLNQNFDTLADALDAIKRVGPQRRAPGSEVGVPPRHHGTHPVRLDTSQLPRPFQIGVVGQADWNIATERTARLAMEKQK